MDARRPARRRVARRRGCRSTPSSRRSLDAAMAALRATRPSPHEGARATSPPSTRTPRACRRASSPAASPRSRARRCSSASSGSRPNMDDLRLLLMREPRGHSRDVRRDPPAADARRRRLGRAVHRGVGLPADVRARDDRRRDRAGRDRDGRGDRARDGRAARHARRARRRAGRRSRDGRADGGDAAQRARRSSPRATRVRRGRRARRPSPTTWRSAATSTRIVDAAAAGVVVDPARAERLIDVRRRRSWTRSTRVDRPVHPEDPRIAGCHHVVLHAAGRRRRRTRARRPRSTPAGWTARRAGPGPARGWRSCTRAASSASARRSSTSR